MYGRDWIHQTKDIARGAADQPTFSSVAHIDALLARAGSGLLSRSLVYAAHHRPRRATLGRLCLAERLSLEATSLGQLVAVLSVGLEALLTAVVRR
jgi:hypothetical protein